MWLFFLFVMIPIIEIGLFIQLGGWLGMWPTLGVVVATAALGTFLVRSQGLVALNTVKSNMQQLHDPTEALAHGALILIAGLLLLTPGFFTDAIGFILLIPPLRGVIIRQFSNKIMVSGAGFTQSSTQHRPFSDPSDIIEGEYFTLDDPPEPPGKKPSSGWSRH